MHLRLGGNNREYDWGTKMSKDGTITTDDPLLEWPDEDWDLEETAKFYATELDWHVFPFVAPGWTVSE